ncbi:MAG: nitroreductase family protein, partial [Coriobacteriia bacterium]|nr:nitroreductase family protein [Coriobacteriia bacterium]
TKASHLVLCGAVYPDLEPRSIERAIAESAMTMQVAVLAATELGLGTCWMAGIHHERVETAYPMPDGARLVAISTLGSGPERMRLSWDTVAYHLVSKRRKPLHRLWMREGWMVLP